MSRPLVITDCDEVLLYMVGHFQQWLAEEEGVSFDLGIPDFHKSMRDLQTGELLEQGRVWELLNKFFDGQMHRQTPVEGAVAAIAELSRDADVVVLTNLMDFRRDHRVRQLADHGIDLKVYTNQGPKGPALKAILHEYAPGRAVFIDDIAQHHGSVGGLTPHVGRLHLCAEPRIARHIPCAHEAGDAHARIDTWNDALPWLLERLHGAETDNTKDLS